MVASGNANSCIISGSGGLGKTFTVVNTLLSLGFKEGESFHHIKGYATSRGLFDAFNANQQGLFVFDDCDNILTDKAALNLLKGASSPIRYRYIFPCLRLTVKQE